jgi:nucleotide-binding universal stress UspA family protein
MEEKMISRILLAADGSDHATAAWCYAIDLALLYAAQLRILSVVDTRVLSCEPALPVGVMEFQYDGSGALEAAAEEAEMECCQRALVERMCGESMRRGIRTDTSVVHGIPADAILGQEPFVDLIAMGHQGNRSALDRMFTGSVAQEVIWRSAVPVLVAQERYRPIQQILVAYDGSAPARRALHWAADLANRLDAPLAALHVNRSPERGSAVLAEAVAYLQDHYTKDLHTILRTGRPGPIIMETAQDMGSSLIVMGAYGQNRLRHATMGSVTEQVLRKAESAVLMTR